LAYRVEGTNRAEDGRLQGCQSDEIISTPSQCSSVRELFASTAGQGFRQSALHKSAIAASQKEKPNPQRSIWRLVRMSAKITDEQLMKAVRLWGLFSNSKAAQRLGMTERNFYHWISEAKRRGLVDARERHPRAMDPNDLEKTFRACREHSTISAAAEALRITPKAVRARLRAAQAKGGFDETGKWSPNEDPFNLKKRASEYHERFEKEYARRNPTSTTHGARKATRSR
jgi:hypothetical protein